MKILERTPLYESMKWEFSWFGCYFTSHVCFNRACYESRLRIDEYENGGTSR